MATSAKLSEDLQLEFPIAVDDDRRLTKSVGLFDAANDISWPAVIVVDQQGKVAWRDVPDSYVYERRPDAKKILEVLDGL